MTWLVIIALAIWAFRLNQRVGQLETKVRILSSAPPVVVAREPSPVAAAPPRPPILDTLAPTPPTPTPAPAPIPTPEPPKPAVPAYKPAYIPSSAPAPAATKPAPLTTTPTPPAPLSTPRPSPPPRPPRPAVTWAQASTWLAENGLAWLGGGGLALGGLLLVVMAAQRGVFTPPFRIIAAALLGLAMVAASEWIRRQTRAPGGRHALAAAAAAGAGAVTLYGAVWAAHGLYGLIPLPVAAVLAVAVSLGLLALSLLHGEDLALLALFGAFLAPWMTGNSAWSPLALEGYLALLGVTGASINALRRWARGGLVTLVGLLIWTLVQLVMGRQLDAAILMTLGLAGPVAAVLWRGRSHPAETVAVGDLFARLPLIALIAASVGSLGLWTIDSPVTAADSLQPLAAGFVSLLVMAGATLAARRRVPALAFAAPVGGAVLGLLTHLLFHKTPAAASLWPVFGLILLIAASGLAAALRAEPKARTSLLAISAVAAAVVATAARPFFDHGSGTLGSVLAGLTAVLLAAGTIVIARRVEDVRRDAGLGLWVAAAAELLFLTIHATTPIHLEPAALALGALALAAIGGRLAWRGLAATAVAGGLVALAMMLRPSFVADATSGQLSLPLLAAVTAVAAAALLAGARVVRGRLADHRAESEALSTAALLILLSGLFLILHTLLAKLGPPAVARDVLLEAGLRTALILAAGLLLAMRGRVDDGPIARWRLIGVTTVGALHGLLTAGLVLNPWWGLGHLAGGLPVLNDLILVFLAPALLLAATAHRRADAKDAWTRGWMAAAAVFALLWVVMTVRHGFHGAGMHHAPIGRAEGLSYALIGLLTARAFQIDRLNADPTAWLRAAAPAVGWIAVAVASLVFGWLAHPWWGPFGGALTSPSHLVLVLALYVAGAGAAFSLRRGGPALARTALFVAVGLALALVAVVVRWAFHGLDLGAPPIGRAEACTHALVGLLTALAFQTVRLDATRTAWLRAAAPGVGWTALGGAVLVFGWLAHPWWGPFVNPMTSPPHLALLLALYAAGAGAAFSLRQGGDALARAALCVAVGLGLALVALLVRTAFHGLDIGAAPVGRAEACAHAVVVLLTARAFLTRRLDIPRAAWLRAAAPTVGWFALALAILVFGWLASPWWGPSDAPLTSTWHVVLILAFYLAGAAAALTLRRGGAGFARAALCVAVGALFAFVSLLVRWAFQGVAMREGLDRGGLETWTFSAVWAVFGLVVLFRASARKDVSLRWLGLIVLLATAGKVLLFDMATLDGVVRAASFLAVGALFIAGALVARRLNAGHKDSADESPDRTPIA